MRKHGWRFLLAVFLAAAQVPGIWAAQEPQSPAVSLQSAADIEEAISRLSQPLDEALVGDVVLAIEQVEDAQQRQQLQRMLDERMAKLAEGLPEPAPSAALTADAPDALIRQRIAALNLKADASVEEVRQRDELVSAIIGIEDPIRREQFLKLLEQREREAETLLEAEVGDSH